MVENNKLNWEKLRSLLSGCADLYLPGQWEYLKYVKPDNLAYDNEEYRPLGVVVCAEAADVCNAIQWRNEQDEKIPVAARSGGHSYAGYSMAPRGLLIHLGRGTMKEIQLEPLEHSEKKLIHMGGGVTLQEMTSFGRVHGLYVPGGRCPTVGMSGLTLGGGIGFNDRKWGLTCDHLAATEVALANGERVRASEAQPQHQELLKACRGGGGNNFGINTKFVYEPQDVRSAKANYFRFNRELKQGDEEGVFDIVSQIRSILDEDEKKERGFECRIGFLNDGTRPTLEVLGQYLGRSSEVWDKFKKLQSCFPNVIIEEAIPFWDAQERLHDPEGPTNRSSKSLIRANLQKADVERIAKFVLGWQPYPDGHGVGRTNAGYVTLFVVGGKIKEPVRPTVYPKSHRIDCFIIDIGTTWQQGFTSVDKLKEQVNETYTALKGGPGQPAYVNFTDPDLVDSHKAYYGENYDELTHIKWQYDPEDVFKFAQGIEPVAPPPPGHGHGQLGD